VPANLLLLVAVSLAWASDYLFIGWADAALPPITIGAATATVAALVLFPVVRLALQRPLLPILREAPLAPIVLGATAVAWPRLSVVYAEQSISADIAALTGTTVPILTLLVSVFVLRQQVYSHLRLLGVLVALAGLAIFVGLHDGVDGASTFDAILMMMSGGVTFVFAGLYTAARAERLDKAALTVWVMAAGAMILAVPALVLEVERLSDPPALALASIAASGIISMALAYLGYFVLIERAGPSFAALYAYLVPSLGVLVGVVFLGERLTLEHLVGLALVLCGLWMITRRNAKLGSAVREQAAG
jgi:drug/metabolite transporter (DMT)-like permease